MSQSFFEVQAEREQDPPLPRGVGLDDQVVTACRKCESPDGGERQSARGRLRKERERDLSIDRSIHRRRRELSARPSTTTVRPTLEQQPQFSPTTRVRCNVGFARVGRAKRDTAPRRREPCGSKTQSASQASQPRGREERARRTPCEEEARLVLLRLASSSRFSFSPSPIRSRSLRVLKTVDPIWEQPMKSGSEERPPRPGRVWKSVFPFLKHEESISRSLVPLVSDSGPIEEMESHETRASSR